MYRQGDVLIVPVKTVPKDARPIQREGGTIVLAHGEATGHTHAIAEPSAMFFEAAGAHRFLSLVKPARLQHEEHAPIYLPAGNYEVIRQREYTPEAIRNVAD